MYPGATYLTAFLALAVAHGPALAATGDDGLVCGHTVALKPGTGSDEAKLRVERDTSNGAGGTLYLLAIQDGKARLVWNGQGATGTEYGIGLPDRLVVVCAPEALGWLDALAPGAPVSGDDARRIEALLSGGFVVKPRGLGPEIHRPDYDGFEAVRLPGDRGTGTFVIALRPRN